MSLRIFVRSIPVYRLAWLTSLTTYLFVSSYSIFCCWVERSDRTLSYVRILSSIKVGSILGTHLRMKQRMFHANAFIRIMRFIFFTYSFYYNFAKSNSSARSDGRRGNISSKSSLIISPRSPSNSSPTVESTLTSNLPISLSLLVGGRLMKRLLGV